MADGFPLLLTTTASLDELNARIAADHPDDPRKGAALPMERFRPNLVVSGTAPWAEDGWRRIRVGGLEFRVAKPCGRCVVTTTDQETGERRGPEPLRALGRHHRFGQKLVFGQNLVPVRPPGPPRCWGRWRSATGWSCWRRRRRRCRTAADRRRPAPTRRRGAARPRRQPRAPGTTPGPGR
ncbi:MOSC domain-containing protein [Kitasatospora fiedleri]|uniref:MOSC domain-containing protein n=1 Tax=Kitasatospora fiedleri TaxID=2991545 RepID=UPI00384DB2EB